MVWASSGTTPAFTSKIERKNYLQIFTMARQYLARRRALRTSSAGPSSGLKLTQVGSHFETRLSTCSRPSIALRRPLTNVLLLLHRGRCMNPVESTGLFGRHLCQRVLPNKDSQQFSRPSLCGTRANLGGKGQGARGKMTRPEQPLRTRHENSNPRL